MNKKCKEIQIAKLCKYNTETLYLTICIILKLCAKTFFSSEKWYSGYREPTEQLSRALNWGDQSQKVEFVAVPLIPQFHIFCQKLIGPMRDDVQIEMRSNIKTRISLSN